MLLFQDRPLIATTRIGFVCQFRAGLKAFRISGPRPGQNNISAQCYRCALSCLLILSKISKRIRTLWKYMYGLVFDAVKFGRRFHSTTTERSLKFGIRQYVMDGMAE